ncbi:MAG: hypothetical protein H2060_01850 [Azoarcus sp.]|nr:hypothetical protein [Azoarcus sp.]
MASASLKRWLHFVGGGLGLAGVVFVGVRLYEQAGEIDLARFGITSWSILGLLALVYGAANVLLARAWWCQLMFFELRTAWPWALRAYGLSQLAKYVPGNIFHLAGRQALGMAAGFPARPLAKSAAWEFGSIAVVGACFGSLALPLIWPVLKLPAAIFLFIGLLAALYFFTARALSKTAATALLWQASFLTLSGLLFIGTLALVADYDPLLSLSAAIAGAYVVAWLAGLVTPGAPAGVGVREMVLLLLLEDQVSPEALLLAIILGRIVTVTGDLLFFSAMAINGKLDKAFERTGNNAK